MNITKNTNYLDWERNNNGQGYITFFTPTYNRSYFLPRVYKCLKNQTNKHFVWILVNDGSSDNTEVVANDLLSLSDFPIMYLSKENGGKHSAFKVALDNTRTEYFQCMDDDDIFSPEAVNTYLSEWARIKKQGKDSEIGAIRTLTKYAGKRGSIVSSRNFPLPGESI